MTTGVFSKTGTCCPRHNIHAKPVDPIKAQSTCAEPVHHTTHLFMTYPPAVSSVQGTKACWASKFPVVILTVWRSVRAHAWVERQTC